MQTDFLGNLGIDAGYLIVLLFMMQILLFILLISVNMKYNRLKRSYSTFMKGKDGKNLEESIFERFEILDELNERTAENQEKIDKLYKKVKQTYQKTALVRYDAFHEMGGNLSFALTMLDEENSGWIFNAMHSRGGCYTYIKEIVKGESYIELAEEEKESLERAIFQEAYDIRDAEFAKKKNRK